MQFDFISQASADKNSANCLQDYCKLSANVKEKLSQLVSRRLNELNLKKSELARLMKRSRAFIGDIANATAKTKSGEYRLGPEDVDKLSKYLQISRQEILSSMNYETDFNVSVEDIDYDSELAHLFHNSRSWSADNREEAIENAKVIFRRYQEKERKRLADEDLPEISQDKYIEEIDRELEEYHESKRRGEPIPTDIQIQTPQSDEINEAKLEFKNGKFQEKKPLGRKPKGTK